MQKKICLSNAMVKAMVEQFSPSLLSSNFFFLAGVFFCLDMIGRPFFAGAAPRSPPSALGRARVVRVTQPKQPSTARDASLSQLQPTT